MNKLLIFSTAAMLSLGAVGAAKAQVRIQSPVAVELQSPIVVGQPIGQPPIVVAHDMDRDAGYNDRVVVQGRTHRHNDVTVTRKHPRYEDSDVTVTKKHPRDTGDAVVIRKHHDEENYRSHDEDRAPTVKQGPVTIVK